MNLNCSSIYLNEAKELFCPLDKKTNFKKISTLQFIKHLFTELMSAIPRYFQKRRFIQDFSLRVFKEEGFAVHSTETKKILSTCKKKLQQLNALYAVHVLITKKAGYTLPVRLELNIKKQIIEVHKFLNKAINDNEEQKKLNSVQEKKVDADLPIDPNNQLTPTPLDITDTLTDSEINAVITPYKSSLITEPTESEDSEIPTDSLEKLPNITVSSSKNEEITYNEANPLDPVKKLAIPVANLEGPSAIEGFLKSVKKWSGIKDIGAGIEEMKNGNYSGGFRYLATGSLRMVTVAALTVGVIRQNGSYLQTETFANSLDGKTLEETLSYWRNNRPIPRDNSTCNNQPPIFTELRVNSSEVEPQTIFENTKNNPIFYHQLPVCNLTAKNPINSQAPIGNVGENGKITLVTAYDEGIKDYAQYVTPNQRAFANKHRYSYVEYQGNLAHPRAPYWSKIVALQEQLQKTQEGEWIAWLDASALFTNTEKTFEEIINSHGTEKDIILTTDPQVPINNAVFLIKNTPWTKEWIKKVWERSDLARPGEGNCWSWGEPFCHYEQQAMTELWQKDQDVQAHTALISNKEMNSFYRYSHHDPYRDIDQNYDDDPVNSKWASGDFICKVTGMDRDRRLAIIKHVALNCVDTPCEWKKF